jgi:hypothetical protein
MFRTSTPVAPNEEWLRDDFLLRAFPSLKSYTIAGVAVGFLPNGVSRGNRNKLGGCAGCG